MRRGRAWSTSPLGRLDGERDSFADERLLELPIGTGTVGVGVPQLERLVPGGVAERADQPLYAVEAVVPPGRVDGRRDAGMASRAKRGASW